MDATIGRLVILVRDYDEALCFYQEKLGFETIVDIPTGERRYVHIRMPGQQEMGIWLLKAETPKELARVGRQTEGQPCAVMYTKDFEAGYKELTKRGVAFNRKPQEEGGAIFAHFVDLYGNEFILVQLQS